LISKVVSEQLNFAAQLRVDGAEIAKNATVLARVTSDGGLCIGTGKTLDADSSFSGLIDDVRIYDRAITP